MRCIETFNHPFFCLSEQGFTNNMRCIETLFAVDENILSAYSTITCDVLKHSIEQHQERDK